DGRGIEVRRERDAGERRIAAIAPAIDADALRVGDALGDEPARAVGHVVLHAQAPLSEARFPELAAVTGRAAEIHLEDAVAAIGEELDLGVVAPGVARPRAAVRMDDAREVLRLPPQRHREIAVD